MSSGHPPDSTRDVPGVSHVFNRIDFSSLWADRQPMIAAESATLLRLLGPTPRARTLEIGTGEGRLTSVLRSASVEYVGIDAVPEFLGRVNLESPPDRPARRVAANLYHLPFRDGSFDTLAMVRVFNFLTEPARALTELARVVAPGGSLVISYHPRPSLETLIDDIRKAVADPRPGGRASITFSRLGPPPANPSGVAAYSPSRPEFATAVSASGLRLAGHWDLGLEDYRVTRWVPARAMRTLSDALTPLEFLPVRFARLSKPGTGGPLPPLDRILACPRCGAAPRVADWGFEAEGKCGSCGFVVGRASGVTDARWTS